FTLTFLSLGKIAGWDALFYVIAQFAGGVTGVLASAIVLGPALTRVRYVATVPGPGGPWVAFAAEFAISFLLVSVVLHVSNSRRLARFTPWVAGLMLAIFISLGSALSGGIWTAIWVYFVAPLLAMLSAGRIYRHSRGAHRVFCAKYHHHNSQRCIFRCNYGALHEQ